jgi:hypothetical protein
MEESKHEAHNGSLKLWALHTTLSHAMDHTSFSLVYGSEAMLPIKVEHKSFCLQHFNAEQSNDY